MEDEDFVADSDEDEQEMLEALALAEERRARQILEEAAAAKRQQVAELQEPKQEPKEQVHEQPAVGATLEHPATVKEQEEEEEDEETDGEQEEGEEEEQEEQEEETDGLLEVGMFVEVDSRTWPGINKQGGAGRITRVHNDKAKDGEAEEIFYDVRYVLGGFERHIEREYVHSSRILEQQSNRPGVPRDYYYDKFIDQPFMEKQKEAARKAATRADQNDTSAPHTRKRKRPHRSAPDEQLSEKKQQDRSQNEDGAEGIRSKVSKIDDTMFVFTETSRSSLKVSSRPRSDSARSVRAALSSQAKQRRRHRILDSSDEESADGGAADAYRSHTPDQPEHIKLTEALSNESLATEGTAQVSCGIPTDQHHRRKRKKHKTNSRHFVGGYEHDGEDDGFIQPEGNPTELPEDVVRETELKLANTKDELMDQLQEIFAQQQENMAGFHEEKKVVKQQMKHLAEIPLADLQALHKKICDLEKYVTKILVNAGEDVMNKIIGILHRKRGKPPRELESLENVYDVWQRQLNECSPWIREVKPPVENEFDRRDEDIPLEEIAQAAYSSESGESNYHMDDYDETVLPTEVARVENTCVDPAYDELDFSYDYEPERNDTRKHLGGHSERRPKVQQRGPNISNRTKLHHHKKAARSTTLDDYYSSQGSIDSFRPNFRLIGRQKKILPSDPRWEWAKIARKKQQRTGKGTRERSIGPSSFGISNGYGSVHAVHEVHATKLSSRDDSISVQAQRMYLRNKRFSALPTQHPPRESFLARSAPQNARNTSQVVYAAGIRFDEVIPEKRMRPAEPIHPTLHSSISEQQAVDWKAVFEVVDDDPSSSIDEDAIVAISRQGNEALLAFGHPICGPLVPPYLFFDEEYEFEDCDSFLAAVTRQAARLRQLLNDLRFQENSFMDSLSRGGLGAVDEEGYANIPEWNLLVSLEEAYHRAVASFAVQLLKALEGVSPSSFTNYLNVILEEIAALIRQLPDCDSLFNGCKAYFFFFEVASRDAATTPFLTAVSRTYWYCLSLIVALRPISERLVASYGMANKDIEDVFLRTLPVNRVILAVVLFLFDLYIYLPSSHRVEEKWVNVFPSDPLPALSLWMLVRGCCTSTAGVDQPDQESLSTKEKNFWALLQAVYGQRYFDELARCFIRSESCGGYLRDFEPHATNGGKTENCDEMFESQLLALEATWDLLSVLTWIYTDADTGKYEEAVCDAKWAVVKYLLQPGKRDFLPFNLSSNQSTNLQADYHRRANHYKQHVLKRVTTFSKLWRPSKDIIEFILCQLWDSDAPHRQDDIVELSPFLKQFISRCKELGNSRLRLAAFAGKEEDCGDSTTALCKIIWIQLLKLEKRVHRSRFRRSILNAIPDTPGNQPASAQSAQTQPTAKQKTDWIWGPKQRSPVSIQPVKQPGTTSQRPCTSSGAGKEQISTAVLLTFAIVGVCLECGDEPHFPVERPDKDVRYMEREVDFYCKEILRWTSGKPECEVLAAQALFTLGALLLEKNSTEFPTIFWGFNDRLESSMKNLQANPLVSSTPKQLAGSTVNATTARRQEEKRRQRLQSAAMSPLYQMRDLIRRMLDTPSSGVHVGRAYGPAVGKSLEHIFGAGLEACLNGAIQKFVTPNDLKIAMEIFQLVLPRAPDEPQKCFAFIPAPKCDFDDFDDDIFAHVDQALLSGGQSSVPVPAWTVKECGPRAIQLIISNLRVVLQQLVLNYPRTDARAFDKLYAIDLLGMMISTCEVQFFWSNVTSTSVKSRNLAPRVLGAALKYNPEKEWLSNVFLRENGADQELSAAWLLGTLDVSALNVIPIVFKLEDAPFGVVKTIAQEPTTQNQSRIRDSDYWAMLTDGIVYHLLRNNSIGFGAMDPHALKLLREVASSCKFPSSVHANETALHDVATLYDLHLDVFQSFCKSVGTTWISYTISPSSHNWHEMNQFRVKMVNTQSGIFVSFLEAYKINFRRACSEIDQRNHNWHSFAKLFLRQAGVNTTCGRSYHEMDDTIKSFDERLTGLTTMFRFMYQCMDAFLFYCGEMAIGETNLFFNAMELLFRQVNSAEYPQAIKRLEDQRQRDGVRNVNVELRKDFCPAAMRFVDSVQLFFARQKYPSLLHWFAQTSEIYQTFKKGWRLSPLRTLLVNILDPDGSLGIHSYYPDVGASINCSLDIDTKTVRREAFYLSCGFFNCRCTRSFEHSQAQPDLISCKRLQQLREFVLDDFMRETFTFVPQGDVTSLLETMVPLCQFVRAVLNHANLNANIPSTTQVDELGAENGKTDSIAHHDFQLSELHPCLEWMVECMIKLVPGEEAVNSTICCVVLTELCGIMCEAIEFNDHQPMLELIDLVELVLSYLQTVFVALSKQTTAMISTLFAASVELPPLVKLSVYRFTPAAFRDIVVDERFSQVSNRQMDSYGIRLARAATDLLAAMGRVAHQCKVSSDLRLQGLTTVS
ncbi:hypothetical protein PHYPSEUDO_007088 [Phytophthora pseudosyringae]|uniref:Uncharacterized protein n=1 Tax=Phytophthora pseudosyringae TaxID=221518 RepID=A0A8T1WBB6_9STRA|nr:hypothetical protein PHYPSEUDO_007088 [Phytophthora pseudosyringae]